MNDRIAKVHLLDVPYQIDKTYEYFIPVYFRGQIAPGMFVIVPFGGGNTKQLAVVVETADKNEIEIDRLKTIYSMFNSPDNITLNEEMLKLCVFMKEHTYCTVGEAVRSVLPPSVFAKYNEIYSVCNPIEKVKYKPDLWILHNYIQKEGKVGILRIKSEYGGKAEKTLNQLLELGLVRCDLEFKENNRISETFVTLKNTDLTDVRLGAKQAETVEYLSENGTVALSVLKDFLSVSQSTIKSLADRDIITLEKIESYRDPYKDTGFPAEKIVLSDKQSAVAGTIINLCRSGKPNAVLMRGVTGSGKTSVIKAAVDEVTAAGKQVIILVPEISLTPQIVAVFKSYYGGSVIVMHSLLSAGERIDAWRMMKNGAVNICIGTRSAIFAPFDNIGLIVIDEEQEHTYKSEMNPKYHAKDIARFRCGYHNAVMLLSSATPSVESYYKAKQGSYTLVTLDERYGGAVIPKTIKADLSSDMQNGIMSPIGTVLRKEIEKNLQNHEQTILFLNRRGYNNYVNCPLCGQAVMCPRCSVSLTFHNTKGKYLQCHYCGHAEKVPEICPSCGGKHMVYTGWGTQKVEEELNSLYPEAKIMRMDADTTSFKFSYDEMLDRFRNHDADILLGTQMVTKGHDFPDVTLVGVISADMSLYVSDYRANERTFSLITQVIGRSGRAGKEGRAVIQTYSPNHPVLAMAADQDYEEFFDNEIAYRKAFLFQPFCDIVVLTFTSEAEIETVNITAIIAKQLNELKNNSYKDIAMFVFGPFEAPIYKMNNRYRMNLIVKCKMNSRTREFFRELLGDYRLLFYKKITISIDVNPTLI